MGETLFFMGKYSGTGFLLAVPYFALNEAVNANLTKRRMENYFVSHSITSFAIMPLFAVLQKVGRGLGWRQSRFLAYRYVGTMCCASLVGEFFIETYKRREKGDITKEKIENLITLKRTEE
jgi:hypothetical protein